MKAFVLATVSLFVTSCQQVVTTNSALSGKYFASTQCGQKQEITYDNKRYLQTKTVKQKGIEVYSPDEPSKIVGYVGAGVNIPLLKVEEGFASRASHMLKGRWSFNKILVNVRGGQLAEQRVLINRKDTERRRYQLPTPDCNSKLITPNEKKKYLKMAFGNTAEAMKTGLWRVLKCSQGFGQSAYDLTIGSIRDLWSLGVGATKLWLKLLAAEKDLLLGYVFRKEQPRKRFQKRIQTGRDSVKVAAQLVVNIVPTLVQFFVHAYRGFLGLSDREQARIICRVVGNLGLEVLTALKGISLTAELNQVAQVSTALRMSPQRRMRVLHATEQIDGLVSPDLAKTPQTRKLFQSATKYVDDAFPKLRKVLDGEPLPEDLGKAVDRYFSAFHAAERVAEPRDVGLSDEFLAALVKAMRQDGVSGFVVEPTNRAALEALETGKYSPPSTRRAGQPLDNIDVDAGGKPGQVKKVVVKDGELRIGITPYTYQLEDLPHYSKEFANLLPLTMEQLENLATRDNQFGENARTLLQWVYKKDGYGLHNGITDLDPAFIFKENGLLLGNRKSYPFIKNIADHGKEMGMRVPFVLHPATENLIANAQGQYQTIVEYKRHVDELVIVTAKGDIWFLRTEGGVSASDQVRKAIDGVKYPVDD